jgi:hypothetical protein
MVSNVAKTESEFQMRLLEKEIDIMKTRLDISDPAVDDSPKRALVRRQSSAAMGSLMQRKNSFMTRKASFREVEEKDIVTPLFRQLVEAMSPNELRIKLHDHETKLRELKVCFGLLPPPPPPTEEEVEAQLTELLQKSKHEAKRKAQEVLDLQRELIEKRCNVSILLRYKGNYEVTGSAVINGRLLQHAPDLPDQNAAPPPPDPAKVLLNRLLAAKKEKLNDDEPKFEEGGILWVGLDSPSVAFGETTEVAEGAQASDIFNQESLGKARICVRIHVIDRDRKTKLANKWRVEVVEGDGAEWWVRGSKGTAAKRVTGDDDGEEGMRLEVCWMGKEVGLMDWVPYRLGMEVEDEKSSESKKTKIIRGSLGNIWRPMYQPAKGARGVRKAVSHGRGHNGSMVRKYVLVSNDKNVGSNVVRVEYDSEKYRQEESSSSDKVATDALSPTTKNRTRLKELLKTAGVATMISLSLSSNSEEK